MPNDITAFLASHNWIIILVILWTIPWKGVALWKAARNSSPIWFIAILVLNTLAVLEIIYIFFFSKKKLPPQPFEASGIKNVEKRVLDIKRD
jgi:magnesium-transporting ATPase (P-type)